MTKGRGWPRPGMARSRGWQSRLSPDGQDASFSDPWSGSRAGGQWWQPGMTPELSSTNCGTFSDP